MEFKELSREDMIKAYEKLEEENRFLRIDLNRMFEDIKTKDREIDFLRQVILNLTGKK